MVRTPISTFDLLAGVGACFLINVCITAIVPVALSSAEARGHALPLTSSGFVAATTSVGMVLSVAVMYQWPDRLMDAKTPFIGFAALLLGGNLAFFLAEWLYWPVEALLACRVLMSLGFGAAFASKRRMGTEPDPQRREYLFMFIELASSLGMAAGPLVTGGLANVLPHRSVLFPPLALSALAAAFLVVLVLWPLDVPLQDDGPPECRASAAARAAAPAEGADGVSAGACVESGRAPGPTAARRPLAESTPLLSKRGAPTDDTPHANAETAPTWAVYAVQGTCLLFGVSRNFLKYGFESAMVVVYDRQLMYAEGTAGLIAGGCALSALFSSLGYKYVCAGRLRTATLLLIAEVLGFCAAALMLATALYDGDGTPLHLAAAATPDDSDEARALLALTFAASMLFYPSMYLGAALGNSHPLRFARPGHRFLSSRAMVAQQEVLQTTLGKGLGMLLARVVLGNPAKVSNLGALFAVVMGCQAVVLALGWDPRATARAFGCATATTSNEPRAGQEPKSR